MNVLLSFATLLAGAAFASAQTAVPTNIVLAGGGYRLPELVLDAAPGQVMVVHVHGVATQIDSNLVAVAGQSGYPKTLGGLSVDLIQGKVAAPTATSLGLIAAYQTRCPDTPCSPITAITLQIPFELDADYMAKGNAAPWLRISENGKVVGGVTLQPVTDNVHVINTCDDAQIFISAASSAPRDICVSDVMHGQKINSLYNLAHGGDQAAMWLYGMGAKTDASPDCCVSPEQLSRPTGKFLLNFDFRPNAPAVPPVEGYGLTSAPVYAAYVGGPYQVNFTIPPVPAGVPACDGVRIKSNLTVTIAGPNSYDAAQICVAP